MNLVNHPAHVVLDGPRGRLDRDRQSEDSRSMHDIVALRRNSAVVTNFSCSPTRRQKPAWRVAVSTIQTTPPCSTKVDVFETGDVSILFSLSQMRNLSTTVELHPKGDKITCPAFGLYSSPVECSIIGDIVLYVTSLSYQSATKSREQPGHPKRHAIFAMSERKPAHPKPCTRLA